MNRLDLFFPGMASLPNLHPLFVHFPIAFFFGALVMEGVAIFYDEKCHLVASWMLYLGAVSAVMALATGFIAESSLAVADPRGHDSPGHDYIHIHRAWMVASTLLGVLTAGYLFWINYKKMWATHYFRLLIGLMLLSLVVSMGADRGGRLVFEFGTGVKPSLLKDTDHNDLHDNGDKDDHH